MSQYLESRYWADLESKFDEKNSKFSLGWALIRSKYKEDIRRGISLLEELRFTDSARDRECRFYISVGYFKLGQYKKAKEYIEPIKLTEPRNAQVALLSREIDEATNRGIYLYVTLKMALLEWL